MPELLPSLINCRITVTRMSVVAKPLAGYNCIARWITLSVALGLLMSPAQAGAVNGQFSVTVSLRSTTSPALENAAFCRTSPALAFGALVTVVCATGEVVDVTASARGLQGAPVHGGSYRFILPGSYAGGLPDLYDGYTGFGTVATWRIVQLADRDYYELLLGW